MRQRWTGNVQGLAALAAVLLTLVGGVVSINARIEARMTQQQVEHLVDITVGAQLERIEKELERINNKLDTLQKHMK